MFALLLWLAVTAAAVAVHYHAAQILIPVTWLAVGPLLASLLLAPLATAALAGWAVLLGVGLMLDQAGHPEGCWPRLPSSTPCCGPLRSGGSARSAPSPG